MRRVGKDVRGQIAGQIFIYIVAIVVVGFIIVYGYSAVKSFRQRGEEVEYISLKTNIESSVKGIVSDYGSVRRPDFMVPSKYSSVCFVKKELAKSSDGPAAISASPLCRSGDGDDFYEPIACEGWKTGRSNVFLIPDGTDAFDVGAIQLTEDDDNFLCVPVVNGRLRVTLTGKGDRVMIEEYIPEGAQ